MPVNKRSFCSRVVVLTVRVRHEDGLHGRDRHPVHVIADVELAARGVHAGRQVALAVGRTERRTLAGHGGAADVEYRAECVMLLARCDGHSGGRSGEEVRRKDGGRDERRSKSAAAETVNATFAPNKPATKNAASVSATAMRAAGKKARQHAERRRRARYVTPWLPTRNHGVWDNGDTGYPFVGSARSSAQPRSVPVTCTSTQRRSRHQ